jgi:hypothetical protein
MKTLGDNNLNRWRVEYGPTDRRARSNPACERWPSNRSTSQTELHRATRCRNGKEGSVYSGGGLLTEAARRAGYKPAFAIELDSRYAEIYENNHNARMFNLSVEDTPIEELPQVELLTMGIPCDCFSTARTKDKVTGATRDRSLTITSRARVRVETITGAT